MPKRRDLLERLYWTSGWVYDFSKLATTLLIVGLITHYFLYTVLVVKGKSMEPSYIDGEALTVNKISYLVSKPKRFDVVAMYFPGETEKRFIKRIIGLPGEKISVKDGRVYVNDVLLGEKYLSSSLITAPDSEKTLQKGEYFVMGDNRLVSSDSRAWGPVPKSFIVGKVGARLSGKGPTLATNSAN